jgi:hypothetical protein
MKKELRAHLLKIIQEIWEKKQRVPFREFVRYLNNAFPSDAPVHIQKQTYSRILNEFMKEKGIMKKAPHQK